MPLFLPNKSTFETATKHALARFGLELRRTGPKAHVPELYADPLAAMHIVRGGGAAAFQCPVDKIIDVQGFSASSWHPFTAMLQVYRTEGRAAAHDFLMRYYDAHQPKTLAQALLGFDHLPKTLVDSDPLLYAYHPWTNFLPSSVLSRTRKFIEKDNIEHGRPDLKLRHGVQYHGPVDPEKGALETERLCRIYEAMKAGGYDRTKGDVHMVMLRRGRDVRYLTKGGGYHRTYALCALGHDWVPAQFYGVPAPIDIAEVEYWPQVQRGVWTKEEAAAYFDHLFDFDALAWAQAKLGI